MHHWPNDNFLCDKNIYRNSFPPRHFFFIWLHLLYLDIINKCTWKHKLGLLINVIWSDINITNVDESFKASSLRLLQSFKLLHFIAKIYSNIPNSLIENNKHIMWIDKYFHYYLLFNWRLDFGNIIKRYR